MRPYKGCVIGKIIIGGIKTEMRISNGRARHVDGINDLLKEEGGAVVRVDVVNDGEWNGEEKQNTLFI